ncbi:MAG: hypothetical protein FJZ79_01585 [Chlorobi bacterium]|nr:hypothetical protein [Chlorobiota bacterium]
MKRCPVSHLPVREDPGWIAPHPENDYTTVFSLIGHDIIHFVHRSSKSEITLSGIDSRRFITILQDLDLSVIPVYLLVDLDKVTTIGYHYGKNFLNFAFNWGKNIRMVVLYNVSKEVRDAVERFFLIAPENVCMAFADNYREAVEMVLGMKNRKNGVEPCEPHASGSTEPEKELLAAMTRMSMLQIFNQQIHLPASGHELHPYFLAVEGFRKDMIAKETLTRERKKALQRNYEQKYAMTHSHLQREIGKHTAAAKAHAGLVLSLETDILMNEEKLLKQKSLEEETTVAAERIRARLQKLCGNDLLEHYYSNPAGTEIIPNPDEQQPDAADMLFIDQLKQNHPSLNAQEMNICLLIRKNYPTKTIAGMMALSTRGMENIRYRLHKKLGLGKHRSMKTYLCGM